MFPEHDNKNMYRTPLTLDALVLNILVYRDLSVTQKDKITKRVCSGMFVFL